MVTVKLSATVGKDRRIVIDVPKEIPIGRIELILRTEESTVETPQNVARETARARLLAADALVIDLGAPENVELLSPEELLRLGNLPENAPSSLDLIDEDRGQWRQKPLDCCHR